jgi:tetratricopeptide (TPR) repeat protein
MEDKIQKVEQVAKKDWRVVMSWVGGISALLGLFASLAGGIAWFVNHHKQKTEIQAKMALAQEQEKQGQYQAAMQSYGEILKTDPLYRPALDQQLRATMLWVEDFHVLAREDQNAADLAAPALDQIIAILDGGLTQTKGSQAADVQAHLGWAHWLNQHIAEREFGPAGEQSLRAALVTDPSNVYANAMLGNWMLQNNGSFPEAIQHLNTAVATGKARPFIRKLQLGGLIYLDQKGARAELVKAANDMRKSDEPLGQEQKRRILGFCFDPVVIDYGELAESLSAAPPDEIWQTYLWLDNLPEDAQGQSTVHDSISANMLELSGKRQESLEKYRLLQKQLQNQTGSLKNSVDAAVARLSQR